MALFERTFAPMALLVNRRRRYPPIDIDMENQLMESGRYYCWQSSARKSKALRLQCA